MLILLDKPDMRPTTIYFINRIRASMKRFDGLSPREIEKFYAVSFAEEPKSMAELINLSFNLHCYSLIKDFVKIY